MRDKFSESRIAELHPAVRQIFTDFINECEKTFDITLRVTTGYRSIEDQAKLYAQGRTRSGKIVTNAEGGHSYHNYGLAIDLVRMQEDDTSVDWNYDISKLKPIADKYGIEWGGTWNHIVDKPHFQIKKVNGVIHWENCGDLLALVKQGKVDKEGYVIL